MASRTTRWGPAVAAALALMAGPAAGTASAGIFICVPAAGAVTSGGTSGACGTATPVELPQSRAEQQTLLSILPYLSFNATGVGGKPTIAVKGANLQILNGTGSTTTANGAGNLILGYNEYPGTQTGSHSLVSGQSNSFQSYGQFVSGTNNKATAPWATAVGYFNTASGPFSSVLGGYSNTATNFAGVVVGGHDNVAKGESSAILGGSKNSTEGTAAAMVGGFNNIGRAAESAVLGGNTNVAAGKWSTVAGGKLGTVSTLNGTGDGTHFWVRVDGNGAKVAESGTVRGQTIDVYDYTGGWTLAWFRGLDVGKCSVSVEPSDSSDVDIGYRYITGEYVYVQTKRNGAGADGIGLSITADCNNPAS
jgi:hypothetical protein